jgi:glycerol-3-phosphate responsive antiterminator
MSKVNFIDVDIINGLDNYKNNIKILLKTMKNSIVIYKCYNLINSIDDSKKKIMNGNINLFSIDKIYFDYKDLIFMHGQFR